MANEFDMEEVTATSSVPSVPSEYIADEQNGSSSGTLSLDDLGNIGFNDTQDEAERAKLNPPTGDWEKDDRWEFKKTVNNNDSITGDIDPTGRTYLSFAGKPIARQANGIEYQPMMFIRLSPDRRYKVDKPTDVDMAYKLFLKAKDIYLELKAEKPTKLLNLVTMITEDNIILRTMNGDNGPIVVDIKAKKTVAARQAR